MALDRRLELHQVLVGILGHPKQVYFQPPANIQMQYPAIVYQRDNEDVDYADNTPYSRTKRYSVTVIDRDPDSEIPNKVGQLPMSSFSRYFAKDDLNHDVYTLYI